MAYAARPSDAVPRFQLGSVMPASAGDFIHYQFYRIFPPDCLLLSYKLGLQEFSLTGAESALEQFLRAIDYLAERRVDRITQSGIPISAHIGRPQMLKLIEQAQRRAGGIPCTADFEESIEALRALGARKVVVAAKWDERLMGRVRAYLADAGIESIGTCNDIRTAQQVVRLSAQEGIDIGVGLGRRAFGDFPQADALLLAGGGWPVMEAIRIIEAEFNRPVVSNPIATLWAGLRQFGCVPEPGFGRLIAHAAGKGG